MTDTKTETEITQQLLGLELYVIETSPARSEYTQAVLPEHIEHQIRLEREGILFASGPIYSDESTVPSAGMIVVCAASLKDAKRIADSDPFHIKGIRTYTIRKWIINEGSMDFKILLSDQRIKFK
ncbi:MAG: hypothetical protein COB84_01520 [Rhodobacteraceae bacterium]|nr:MAG: hypothetical protein COB84_01520 [Paracoccaceae bacterium]